MILKGYKFSEFKNYKILNNTNYFVSLIFQIYNIYQYICYDMLRYATICYDMQRYATIFLYIPVYNTGIFAPYFFTREVYEFIQIRTGKNYF